MSKFIKLKNEASIPERATKTSAGYDLRTPIDFTIEPNKRLLIPIGITCKMEDTEYLQIVPKSGLAINKGITVLNTPGTVDADYYPNEIGVILYNTSENEVQFKKGDKIAQAILQTYAVLEDENKPKSKRESGFGSTGR